MSGCGAEQSAEAVIPSELSGGAGALLYPDGSVELVLSRLTPGQPSRVALRLTALQRRRLFDALLLYYSPKDVDIERAERDEQLDFDRSLRAGQCPRCYGQMARGKNPRHPGLGDELSCACGLTVTE